MKTAIVHAQQKWEHVVITRKTDGVLVEEANLLGEEGWQMVSTDYIKDAKGVMTWVAFLKRPKTGQAVKQPTTEAAASATAAQQPAAGDAPGFDLSGDVFDIKT